MAEPRVRSKLSGSRLDSLLIAYYALSKISTLTVPYVGYSYYIGKEFNSQNFKMTCCKPLSPYVATLGFEPGVSGSRAWDSSKFPVLLDSLK